jgi:hypothetical protein
MFTLQLPFGYIDHSSQLLTGFFLSQSRFQTLCILLLPKITSLFSKKFLPALVPSSSHLFEFQREPFKYVSLRRQHFYFLTFFSARSTSFR